MGLYVLPTTGTDLVLGRGGGTKLNERGSAAKTERPGFLHQLGDLGLLKDFLIF